MPLTAYQKIGLVGIGLIVVGGNFGIVLPQAVGPGVYTAGPVASGLIAVGGFLLMIGIIGGFLMALYRAGVDHDRWRHEAPPPRR